MHMQQHHHHTTSTRLLKIPRYVKRIFRQPWQGRQGSDCKLLVWTFVFFQCKMYFSSKNSPLLRNQKIGKEKKKGVEKKKEKKRKLGQGINSRWFVPYYYFTTACENNSKNSLHSHFQDPISHIVWMKPQSNCTLNSELSYICLCRCKWLPRSSHISRNATFEKLTWTSFFGAIQSLRIVVQPPSKYQTC